MRKIFLALLIFLACVLPGAAGAARALGISGPAIIDVEDLEDAAITYANWKYTGKQNAASNSYKIQILADGVTVVGAKTEVPRTLQVEILPANVTLTWKAKYIGAPSGTQDWQTYLIRFLGNGTLHLTGPDTSVYRQGAWLENTADGTGIYSTGEKARIIVEKSVVMADTGSAVQMTGRNAVITVKNNGVVVNTTNTNLHPALRMSSAYEPNDSGAVPNVILENGTVGSAIVILGGAVAEGDNGYAIQTRGSVRIAGASTVYVDGNSAARAVNLLGKNAKIEVLGKSTVYSKTGIAINAEQAGAWIIVSDDAVVYNRIADRESVKYPVIRASAADATVEIRGKSIVDAYNRVSTIETKGSVTVSGSATVRAAAGSAISVTGGSGNVSVEGGTVSAATGRAIDYAGTGQVNVTGGIVRASDGGLPDCANGGTAIFAESGTVSVTKGLVYATTGDAINAADAEVSDNGFAFAYGTTIADVVSKPVSFTPTGTGIVAAWSPGTRGGPFDPAPPYKFPYEYDYNGNNDLHAFTGTGAGDANVFWKPGGFNYSNSTNAAATKGFKSLNVDVISPRTLIFNVDDGKFYYDVDSDGVIETVDGDIEYTDGFGSTWNCDKTDPANKILTLNNFQRTTTLPVGLSIIGNGKLIIKQEGDNKFEATGTVHNVNIHTPVDSYGIRIKDSVSVELWGSGTLTGFGGIGNESYGINFSTEDSLKLRRGTAAARGNDGAFSLSKITAADYANKFLPVAYAYFTYEDPDMGGEWGAYYPGITAAAVPSWYSISPINYTKQKNALITVYPVAMVNDVTIKGKVGEELPPGQTATVTLYGDSFVSSALPSLYANTLFNDKDNSLICYLPNGLRVMANRKTDDKDSNGNETVTLYFSGTPAKTANPAVDIFSIVFPIDMVTIAVDESYGVEVVRNPLANFLIVENPGPAPEPDPYCETGGGCNAGAAVIPALLLILPALRACGWTRRR